jgi:osmotically-inducible protein OsmY
MRGHYLFLLLLAAGCSRQDTECLARIGRKLADKAHAAADVVGKADVGWKRADLTVTERVSQRLRTEKLLEGITIDVRGDTEVELRGAVQTAQQRQRALDLAESTTGVEKVTDSLQISE